MKKEHYLFTPFMLGFLVNAHAEDYFDPTLLASEVSGIENIDLSIFSQPGGGIEGEQEVSIYINDEFYARKVLYFKNTADKGLLPDFEPGFFDGLMSEEYLPIQNGKALTSAEFIDGVPYSEVTYDQAVSRVNINLPQAYLSEKTRLKSSPESWDNGVPALLMDYNINGNRNDSSRYDSRSFYASANLGMNLWEWRLRTSANYSWSETDSQWWNSRSEQNNFYNTYLERDISSLRASLRLGEISTGGMILDSISFRGVKLYSNDDMLGSRLRNYTPTVRGFARSQAVVTVTQNGRQVYQTNVPAGPFELDDFYLNGYSGDMLVTIREADGSEHSFLQPFSTLPEMKREGVSGFELSAGRYDNSGSESYYDDPAFFYGSWSQGFMHGITVFGETLQAEKYQSLGVGSTLSLGHFGAVSADMSVSRADKYNDIHTGQSYGVKYSKSQIETGTTLTLATYRYSTKDFYSFDDFASKTEDARYVWENRLKNRMTLNLSQSLGKYGSLSLSASQQDYWTTGAVTRNASISHSFSWESIFFSTTFSMDQMQNRNYGHSNNKQIDLYMSVPLSKFLGGSDPTGSSLSYRVSRSDNQVSNNVILSGRIPRSDVYYRLGGSWGNGDNMSSQTASLSWSGDFTNASLGYTRSGDYKTIDYSLSGAAVMYPWGVALGNSSVTNNGAIVVQTSGASGIRSSMGVKTSWLGTALMAPSQTYTENRVDVYPEDLADDIVVAETSKSAVPTKGAVVVLDYTVFKGSQVVFTLKRTNGKPLPFGTIVSLQGAVKENTGIVGEDGRVYMAGVPEKGELTASWGLDNSCSVSFQIESNNENGPVNEISQVCK